MTVAKSLEPFVCGGECSWCCEKHNTICLEANLTSAYSTSPGAAATFASVVIHPMDLAKVGEVCREKIRIAGDAPVPHILLCCLFQM